MVKDSTRFMAILLLFSMFYFVVDGQTPRPLLLQPGQRVPEMSFSSWQSSFSIAQENVFDGRYYKVLSFASIPTDSERAALEAKGIRLLSYLPVNGYIASIPESLHPAAFSDMGIVAVTDLSPDERMASPLRTQDIPDRCIYGGLIEVVVTLFADVSHTQALDHMQGLGWEHTLVTGNGRILHMMLPVGELYTLVTLPFTQFVEACDHPAEPDNNRGRSLHRATSSFHPGAFPNDYDGSGVRVLINDDGFIGPHIDFHNRIPYQFTFHTGQDHGDHCAGTILGAGNLNPRAMGMAPAADLVVYRASNYPGFDSLYNQYHTLGIRITSTSYSDGCNAGYTARAAMLDEQSRTMPELVHVFSAGNNGTQNCGYGAGSGWGNITGGHKMGKNVIAVANVTYTDNLANSSSRGPAHDGRVKPTVAALGSQVFSTSIDNTYAIKTGTSMACPGAAGTLALMYDAYNRHHGGTPNGGLMKSILMNTAEDLGNPGPDFRFGYGRINAMRAFRVIEDSLWVTDNISQNDSITYTLHVPAGTKELRIMLYWTDFEGAVNASRALVNDLDLVVTGPDSTWLPWVLDHTPNATALNQPAQRKRDSINNAEQVTLFDPTPGTYYMHVHGTAVPMGPQQFFINWLITEDEFAVTWPHEGAALVPGSTEVIRWDALSGNDPFDLEYTTDNGATWDTIGFGIGADIRYFDWSVPAITSGNVQVRLMRDTESYTTTPFTVMNIPQNLTVDWVCTDSMQLSWSAAPGATGYQVMKLGALYMDSIDYTTNLHIVLHGIPFHTEEWFTVRAYGPDQALSRRPVAIKREPGVFNCVFTYDMAMDAIHSPQSMILSACHNNQPVPVSVTVHNNGAAPVSDFTVNYKANQGPVTSDTIMQTIQPGQSLQHTFSVPLPLPGANDYNIAVWVNTPNDQFPFNDTLYQLIRVAAFPTLQIPFLETFESFPLCNSTNGCELDECALGNGWLNAENELFDVTDWITNRGGTPSFFTGPSADNTLGTAMGKYLYLEATNCYSENAELISPCIDLTDATLPVLSFYYHMLGNSMGALRLDVLADGVWHLNQMPVLMGNQGNAWRNRLVPLDQFNGQVINLRFRGLIGPGYTSDMALDDISVVETIGLEQYAIESSLKMFPNPANHEVTITGLNPTQGALRIELLSMQGQLLQQIDLPQGAETFSETFNTASYSPGLYLVRISGTQSSVSTKLVINR